jgi:hypothetical protein
MGLLDFLKNTSKAEQQIEKIAGLSINKKDGVRYVQVSEQVTKGSIISLLEVLRLNNIAFSIYDPIYPPSYDSDKGSYISYSQEKNENKESWNMTFGNHGWSGGIYNISERIILVQLENLIDKKLLSEIKIGKVGFFSHYDVENLDRNRNIKSGIFLLHKYPTPINLIIELNYIVFGSFTSDSYGSYQIYKLTNSKLFVDKSESWHQKRHKQTGYAFEGSELSNEKFLKVKNLLFEYPLELLNQYWNGFYTTGNKNEDKLIIELGNDDFTKTITIDNYEIESENLPKNVQIFRQLIEKLITELAD